MSYLPYRPEPLDAAIISEQDLSLEEQGALLNLKRAMWRNDGSLPNDSYILSKASRSGRRWKRICAGLGDHLKVVHGRVFIEEITTMLKLAIDRRAKAAKARAGSVPAFRQNSVTQFANANALKSKDSYSVQVASTSSSSRSNKNKDIDSKSLSSKNAAAARQANEAYYEAGAKLLSERTGVRFMAARHQIARWLAAVEGEEGELNAILAAVRTENLRGPQFVAVIDQRISARNRELKKGLPLPFPPNLVVSGGS